MEDRRRFVRLNTDVKVKWAKISHVSEGALDSTTASKNISENGICIIMYGKEINTGDKLHLEIELPTKKVIRLEGRVVWVGEFEIFGGKYEKRYDAGIEFLKISDEDKGMIKSFVFAPFRQKAID